MSIMLLSVATFCLFCALLFFTESFHAALVGSIVFVSVFCLIVDESAVSERIDNFKNSNQLNNARIINEIVDEVKSLYTQPPVQQPDKNDNTNISDKSNILITPKPTTTVINVSSIPNIKKRYISSVRRKTTVASLARKSSNELEACIPVHGCFVPYIVRFSTNGTYYACENIRSGNCYILQQ